MTNEICPFYFRRETTNLPKAAVGRREQSRLRAMCDADETNIQQKDTVSALPVSLASTQAGLILDEPMHEKALNPKLRKICDMVGLYGRNTIYAFRRGAIVDPAASLVRSMHKN
jgi:hypothetical protein